LLAASRNEAIDARKLKKRYATPKLRRLSKKRRFDQGREEQRVASDEPEETHHSMAGKIRA